MLTIVRFATVILFSLQSSFLQAATSGIADLRCDWIHNEVRSSQTGEVLGRFPDGPRALLHGYHLGLSAESSSLLLVSTASVRYPIHAEETCASSRQRPGKRCFFYGMERIGYEAEFFIERRLLGSAHEGSLEIVTPMGVRHPAGSLSHDYYYCRK